MQTLVEQIKEHIGSVHGNSIPMPVKILRVTMCHCIKTRRGLSKLDGDQQKRSFYSFPFIKKILHLLIGLHLLALIVLLIP